MSPESFFRIGCCRVRAHGRVSMTALSQDLLTQKVISLDVAQTMAQTAVMTMPREWLPRHRNGARQRRKYQNGDPR